MEKFAAFSGLVGLLIHFCKSISTADWSFFLVFENWMISSEVTTKKGKCAQEETKKGNGNWKKNKKWTFLSVKSEKGKFISQ